MTGSKDNSIFYWDSETQQKQIIEQPWCHKSKNSHASIGEVLAVSISYDCKYLVSGGKDKKVNIYDTRSLQKIKTFDGHRDSVTCLAFKRDSYSLYSGSLDRCIKHWDVNSGYMETLFGHQVTSHNIFFIYTTQLLLNKYLGWHIFNRLLEF